MLSRDLVLRAVHIRAFWSAIVSFFVLAASVVEASDAHTVLLESGKQLVADAKCEACHASKLGGDGRSMYLRPDRRVTTKAKLLSQVARCNNELNLGLFPDDEAAIAAYLNAAHYKFKD